jgi:hypothetical protein
MTNKEIDFRVWFLNTYKREFTELYEQDVAVRQAFLAGWDKGVTETRVSLTETLSRW